MRKGYLPAAHHHRLVDEITPSMRWDTESDVSAWQADAKDKLRSLLGLDQIEPYRTECEIEIEFDRIAEDLGCREIRFHFRSELDVTTPCHMVIPNGATAPLPVVIALQGHGTGMHLSLGRSKFERDLDDEYCRNSPSAFAKRAVEEGVVAVMSTAVDTDREKAEIPEPTSGDPFGYMGGEWNFWEYLGDLMASLLAGG